MDSSKQEGKPDVSKLTSGPSLPPENLVDTVKSGEFPAAGHVYHVDFGVFSGTLDFHSEKKMTFNVSISGGPNISETVDLQVTRIRDDIFMVHWTEKSGSVVHVQDYENEVVYTNATTPDGKLIRFRGTLKKVK